jgi:hypothetical protein
MVLNPSTKHKMKKILINENDSLRRTICSELYAYEKGLRQAKTTYETLELGPFNDEVLRIINSGTAEETIGGQYWSAQEEQLKAAGITNKIIKNNILNDCKGLIDNFIESVRELGRMSLTYNDSLEFIVFENGEFDLVDGYEDKIRAKYCREYCTDPEEAEFLEALKGIHQAYENYLKVAGKVDATFRINRSFVLLDELFDHKDDKWQVSPSKAIYYHRFCKRNLTERRHRM